MRALEFYLPLYVCLLLSLTTVTRGGDGLTLQAVGDASAGYSVEILFDGRPAARHVGGGEFTAVFENSDGSQEARLRNWRATKFSGDENSLVLRGVQRVRELYADIDIRVEYDVINPNVVRKRITLAQRDAPVVLYRLQNRLEPIGHPESYWSFEHDRSAGGALREVYPAAGFRLKNVAVGLLTDAGHRNLWTRADRRRDVGRPGMVSLRVQPDPRLLRLPTAAERTAGQHFVEFNFGEQLDFRGGHSTLLPLPPRSHWLPFAGGELTAGKRGTGLDPFTINVALRGRGKRGVLIPLHLPAGPAFTLRFKHRSDCSVIGTRLWNIQSARDVEFHDDLVVASPTEWREFELSFRPTASERDLANTALYIGLSRHQEGPCQIEVKDLEVLPTTPKWASYHRLDMGETATKTVFIFAESQPEIRALRLASQVRLAEGLGFQGTEAEKIYYATQAMLTWITEPRDLTPHVVPSLSYAPDMFFRDSFWEVLSTHDRKLSEAVWKKWAATQNRTGCVDTIVTPYIGSLENVDNDAVLYFILWAYVNHQRYDTPIDVEKIRLALQYCRSTWDAERRGVLRSRTPASTDTMWVSDKIVWADAQGIYCSVLRAARRMGLDVTEQEIEAARSAYRSLYLEDYGYVVFGDGKGRRRILSPASLLGEFISWWLWDEPLLSSEAVINTLEKLRPTEYVGLPGWCYYDENKGYVYFSREKNPFSGGQSWDAGVYVNGGSWLLYDYTAFVAGLKHGWQPAAKRMRERLEAQFSGYPDWPVNFEWTPTTRAARERIPPERITRVFGWDCFVLIANEVAGLRDPAGDPHYRHRMTTKE